MTSKRNGPQVRPKNTRGRKMALNTVTPASTFAPEEWETWMAWDGAQESLSPLRNFSSQNLSSPSTVGPRSASSQNPSAFTDATSPSEADALPESQFSLTIAPELIARPIGDTKKRRISKEESTKGTKQDSKKVSHNVIEKRYRSNLNDKIAKLRDSVPSLRFAAEARKKTVENRALSDSEGSGDDGATELKFNKATVLVKATEYIQQLEKQNQRLSQENSGLRQRLHTFDHARLSPNVYLDAHRDAADADSSTTDGSPRSRYDGAESVTSMESASTRIKSPRRPADIVGSGQQSLRRSTPENESDGRPILEEGRFNFDEVQGMIPVPEELRRIRRLQPQEHYAPPSRLHAAEEPLIDDGNDKTSFSRGRVLSRIMLGSLACLMVMEGISEHDSTSKSLRKRGLFTLPQELLEESRGFRDPIRRRIIAFFHSAEAQQALPVLKFSIVATAVLFALSYFASRMESKLLTIPPVDDRLEYSLTINNRPRSFSPIRTHEKTSYSFLTEFFARIAIWLFDSYHWIRGKRDSQVIGSPRLQARQFKKRYTSYARSLPKLLDESVQ